MVVYKWKFCEAWPRNPNGNQTRLTTLRVFPTFMGPNNFFIDNIFTLFGPWVLNFWAFEHFPHKKFKFS